MIELAGVLFNFNTAYARIMERNSNGKRPPALNWDNAVSLITRIFPLEDVSHTTFKELLCHEDRLYYFEGQHEGQLTRKQFVLRLSNTKFGHDVVSGHNAVMLHLRARGIHCCEPIVTKLGHHLETLSEADLLQKSGGRDVSYIVRVLTYIPGELMDEVDKCFLTSQLYYDVGYFVGQMDMALQVRRLCTYYYHQTYDEEGFVEGCVRHTLRLF